MGIVQATAREEKITGIVSTTPLAAISSVPDAFDTVVAAVPANSTQQDEHHASSHRRSSPLLKPLPRKVKRAAFIVPAVSTLLFLSVFNESLHITPSNANLQPFLLTAVPCFASLSGVALRSKRLGVLAGGMIGAGAILRIVIDYLSPVTLRQFFLYLFLWGSARYLIGFALGGALFGLIGAALRQKMLQEKERRARSRASQTGTSDCSKNSEMVV